MTTVTLLGVDGSTWNLLDRASPVRLADGLGGLHLPHVTHQWTQTAHGSGRKWNGTVADSTFFDIKLVVGDAEPPFRTNDDWRTLDAQFWQALSHKELARLVVNDQRSLALRLDENNDFTFLQDPALHGKATYNIAVVADTPEWSGKTSTTTYQFTTQDTTNYYGGASGFGPPFIITAPSLFDAASVSNPGDLPAWPIWTLTGPASAVRVGVDDRVIVPPFSLQSGDIVIINTESMTIADQQGNDLWPLMGYAPVDFAAIPPGDAVPIKVGMDNPGDGASIALTITPKFSRAWGVSSTEALAVTPSAGGLGVQPLGTSPLGGGS